MNRLCAQAAHVCSPPPTCPTASQPCSVPVRAVLLPTSPPSPSPPFPPLHRAPPQLQRPHRGLQLLQLDSRAAVPASPGRAAALDCQPQLICGGPPCRRHVVSEGCIGGSTCGGKHDVSTCGAAAQAATQPGRFAHPSLDTSGTAVAWPTKLTRPLPAFPGTSLPPTSTRKAAPMACLGLRRQVGVLRSGPGPAELGCCWAAVFRLADTGADVHP